MAYTTVETIGARTATCGHAHKTIEAARRCLALHLHMGAGMLARVPDDKETLDAVRAGWLCERLGSYTEPVDNIDGVA